MEMNEYPLASFCLVSYNAENYIKEALLGAFEQDYPNLEIVVSDDCSTDRTFEIINEIVDSYNGPHKIIINRNEPNMGPRENFNKVLYELSHGEFLFIAAGDDISMPNRVSRCVELMSQHPDVMSMSVQSQLMSADGVDYELKKWEQLSEHKYSVFTLADYVNYPFMMFSGDSRVLRRDVINKFPPLQYSYSEDVFLFVRSLYLGSIIFLREPLVRYRQHPESIMGKSRGRVKTKEDIKKWESRGKKQLEEDYCFAVKEGYLTDVEALSVRWKLDLLYEWLKPKRKTIYWRIVHRLSKYSSRFFDKLLMLLE